MSMDDQTIERFLNSSFANWRAELLPLLTSQLKGKPTPLEVILSLEDWTALRNRPAILILLGRWCPELRQDKKLAQLFNNADHYYKQYPLALFYLDPANYARYKWVKAEYDKLDSQGVLPDELKKLKPKQIRHRTANPKGIKPLKNFSIKQTYGFFYSLIKEISNASQKDIIELITSVAGYSSTKAFESIKSETLTGIKELNKILGQNILDILIKGTINIIMQVHKPLLSEANIDRNLYRYRLALYYFYRKQRPLLFKSFTISYNELLAWIEVFNKILSDQNVVKEGKEKIKEYIDTIINNLKNNYTKSTLYKESIRQQVLNNKGMMELFDKSQVEFNDTKPKYSKNSLTPIEDIDFDNTKPEYFKKSSKDGLNGLGETNKITFDTLYKKIKEQNAINNPLDDPKVKTVLSELLKLPAYLKNEIKPYKGRKTLLNIGSTVARCMDQLLVNKGS
jgi:hypothetical protein